jgi:hypothetical protein
MLCCADNCCHLPSLHQLDCRKTAPPLAAVDIKTHDASACGAGQAQYAPQGPCYVCQGFNTFNPAAGASCQPCSIANTVPNADRISCVCAAGFQPLVSQATGKLQQCSVDGLSCSSFANSVINIVGNGCACKSGLAERFDSAGKLVACEAPSSIAQMQVTAQSGMRTNISLPSSTGQILSVSNGSAGGSAILTKGIDNSQLITYLSR